jgi:hypothetical protein
MAKEKFSLKADDIIKNPAIVDSHRYPFLQVYEWSADNTGESTATVTNLLASKGWILQQMTASLGGGFSGKQIVIFSVFRRQPKKT